MKITINFFKMALLIFAIVLTSSVRGMVRPLLLPKRTLGKTNFNRNGVNLD